MNEAKDEEAKGQDEISKNKQDDSATAKSSSFVSLKTILKSLGPGVVTGAADDDPSGIATYSQAGAKFGLFFSIP
jgi:Mn2+/Fe2+ NRAMP family transporter